ncbi:MAG: hypothetical protein BRC27_00225 [Nanohaloarchaea archaeon SW_10_44_10]|nr:MAG: hypothetical protein BRC27_00225 [Nanohaloarchaea archaeon SW_10_44_10]
MKGVSQVITSALILAVGVAVAGVYANWAPDFAGGITEDIAGQQSQNLKCNNVGLRIDSAEHSLSGNFTEVVFINTGTINLRKGLTVAAINQSRIKSTDISKIEANSTRTVRIDGDEIPEEVIVTSDECRDVEASTENIETS